MGGAKKRVGHSSGRGIVHFDSMSRLYQKSSEMSDIHSRPSLSFPLRHTLTRSHTHTHSPADTHTHTHPPSLRWVEVLPSCRLTASWPRLWGSLLKDCFLLLHLSPLSTQSSHPSIHSSLVQRGALHPSQLSPGLHTAHTVEHLRQTGIHLIKAFKAEA